MLYEIQRVDWFSLCDGGQCPPDATLPKLLWSPAIRLGHAALRLRSVLKILLLTCPNLTDDDYKAEG